MPIPMPMPNPNDKDPKAKKGFGSITVEPMDPNSAPIGGPGQPILRDGTIPSPRPEGMKPIPLIAPLEKAGSGWKAKNAPAHPEDYTRPGFSGITRV